MIFVFLAWCFGWLLCGVRGLSFLRRKGGLGLAGISGAAASAPIPSRHARCPPDLAARTAPSPVRLVVVTNGRINVGCNRLRGGAGFGGGHERSRREPQTPGIERRGSGRAARAAGPRNRRNPPPTFLRRKDNGQGNLFWAYALAARNFACSRSASLDASRGKNSSSPHGTRTAGFPP